jgi:carbon-monoxide dehydrogenase large subunit
VSAGIGTFGSRSLAVGGTAIVMSVGKVKEKAKRFAAHMLECSVEDVAFERGRIYVKGSPERGVSLAEVAGAAYNAVSLPPDTEPGLEATSYFEPGNFTFPFGTHVAVVEVDVETGKIDLKRFVSVDDCGNVINPMLVEGQIHGGLAQGIAQALYEEAVYDENGQLLSGSLMDYNVPTADQLPTFELARTVTPTDVNPLGAKGIGEAGTIGSTPAIVNAVVDALSPFGIRHIDMMLRPEKVWRAIQSAKGGGR